MANEDSIDETKNPWTLVSSKPIYENPWIKVRHDDVIHPNGVPGLFGLIEFKQPAVGIIPVDEEGYTWLVGQYRYPHKRWFWEIPMGGVPKGESLEAGALRELKEETGLTATRLEHIQTLHATHSISDSVNEIYLAYGLSEGASEPDDAEQLKIKRVLLTQAIRMVEQGEISDAISVAGLLKAKSLLELKSIG